VNGFSVNENFISDSIKNRILSRANEEFDAEMGRRATQAEDKYIIEKSKPKKVDPSKLSDSERTALLKELGDNDPDNKAKGTSRLSDSDRSYGEIADGFRNLGAAFGLGNSVSGHSGFVDDKGKFHPRTDYQPPVRIARGLIKSAWEGAKRIAQFGFDLATFKSKTTVWTDRKGMLKDKNGKNMKDVSRFGLFEEEYHGSTALNKVEVTERFFGLYRSSVTV
jgi:hypothetical protein